MIYEGLKVVGVTKPFKDYTKVYLVCIKSNQFWVVYDETNSFKKAKNLVKELEYDNHECIIIWTKKKGE